MIITTKNPDGTETVRGDDTDLVFHLPALDIGEAIGERCEGAEEGVCSLLDTREPLARQRSWCVPHEDVTTFLATTLGLPSPTHPVVLLIVQKEKEWWLAAQCGSERVYLTREKRPFEPPKK